MRPDSKFYSNSLNGQNSDAAYKVLLESLSQAIWELDLAGKAVNDAPGWRSYTGQTARQWLDEGWLGAVHEEDRARAGTEWRSALETKSSLKAEFRLHRPDASFKWTNIRASPVLDDNGMVLKWVGIGLDIPHTDNARQPLSGSEEEFKNFASLSLDFFYKMSADWRVMTQFKEDGFDTDKAQTSFNWLEKWVPVMDRIPVREAIEKAIVSTNNFNLEHRIYQEDGTVGWVSSRATPLLNEDGQVTAWLGVARNITEQKNTQEKHNFLVRLDETLTDVREHDVIGQAASRLFEEYMECDSAYFEEIAEDVDHSIRFQDENEPVSRSFSGLVNRFQLSPDLFPAGKSLVIHDIVSDTNISVEGRRFYMQNNTGALVIVPLWKEGKLSAAFVVKQNERRDWTPSEVGLVEETAQRIQTAVERAKVIEHLDDTETRFKSLKEAFQAAVDGASLEFSLDLLIDGVIDRSENAGEYAAFYILNENGTELQPVFQAGNMPLGYLLEMRSSGEGEVSPLFELAAASGKPVFVNDVYENPQWFQQLNLAIDYGIRSCWTFPIATAQGIVIGTFAMYFKYSRLASGRDLFHAQEITHAAAVIISRYDEMQQLRSRAEATAASEERLRLVIEATELATWEWNLDSDEVLWNERHFRILGMEVANNPQTSSAFLDRIHPDDQQKIVSELREAIAEHGLYDAEFRIVRSDDGETRWMSGYGRVTEIVNDKPVRMSGVMFDINDRKQAEQALRQSEQRQRAILESAKDYAIIALDNERRVSTWNAGAERMLGYKDTEITGQSGDIFFLPHDRAKGAPEDEAQRAMRYGRAENERWHLRKDGSRFFGSGVTTPLLDEKGQASGLLKVMRDLTAQKQAEEALKTSQERLQKALSIPTVGVFFFDENGVLTGSNDSFLAMSGYSRHQVENKQVNLNEIILTEWISKMQQAMKELKTTGRSAPLEKKLHRPDGSEWWGLCSGAQLNTNEFVEYVLDITYRKNAEEALLEADRRKDEFLALLAHELRNPMATLSNTLMVLELTGGQNEILPIQNALPMMRREVSQLVRLMDDLLDVSRINQGKIVLKFEDLDFTGLIKDTVQSTRPLVESAGRTLHIELPDRPLFLKGDYTRLTQLVHNLLTNALKFTHEDGEIWLTLSEQDGQAVLRIRDNGIGIPADQLERIFGLFAQVDASRTRSQGGLGLGLTLVKEFAEKHGGHVEAKSAGPDQGSEFVIYLPLKDQRHESDE